MKRLGRLLIFTLLIVVFFTMPVEAKGGLFKVIIKGKPMDIIPIVENDRTLVPLRAISEELGFDVEYIEESKAVIIRKGDKHIEIIIDSIKAKVDGKDMELDVKPFIKEEKTYVPLRFISENLAEEVIWDEKSKTILVGKFSDEVNIENTFLYFNEEHRYTLSFPDSWKEEAIIETKDGTLYVYDKKSAERFIEDGYESFGPVFEIRCSDYPVVATFPYEGDYILDHRNGKYIEVLFGRDFQFYPETRDSFVKIFNEGEKTLGSFRMIDEDYSFVEDDKGNYKDEIEVLNDIIDNYVPEGIFNKDEVFTYKKPVPDTSFLYMRIMKNGDEVLIKIESEFDNRGQLIRYHLKSYGYDLEENKLTQVEALELANDFIKRYVDENIEVINIPDLYPSLYEKDKHETYGDEDGKYIVVVDLEHGFIEYFIKQ